MIKVGSIITCEETLTEREKSKSGRDRKFKAEQMNNKL